MNTRVCISCMGSGVSDLDDPVPEKCDLCRGTGEVRDVCYCAALCSCECGCGYDDGLGCICWEG